MEAGVSASLLHYHFASRDALLAEALEHSYELAGTSASAADDEPAPAADAPADDDRPVPAAPGVAARRLDAVGRAVAARRAPPRAAPDAARLYARMHDVVRRRRSRRAWRAASSRRRRDRTVDRLLALIDGYGIRTLTEDPAMPLERARDEIWAAIARRARASLSQRLALGGGQRAARDLERRRRLDRRRRRRSRPSRACGSSRGRRCPACR